MIKAPIVWLFFSFIAFYTLTNTKLAEAHRTFHSRSFTFVPWSYGLDYTTNIYGYHSYYGYYLNPSYRYYGAPPLYYPYSDPFFYSQYRSPIYYPSLISPPATPPVYIQQSRPTIIPENKYWYYCETPAGYYPNIKECQTEWIKVPPRSAE